MGEGRDTVSETDDYLDVSNLKPICLHRICSVDYISRWADGSVKQLSIKRRGQHKMRPASFRSTRSRVARHEALRKQKK